LSDIAYSALLSQQEKSLQRHWRCADCMVGQSVVVARIASFVRTSEQALYAPVWISWLTLDWRALLLSEMHDKDSKL